jgi:hypothetical protein
MKTKFTALVIFCSSLLFAQNKIFQHSINENNLNSTQKISEGLAKTYVLTQYFSQPSFTLNSDLDISLPTHQEIKAKFKTTYKYSNGSISYVYAIENDPAAELVFSKYKDIVTGMYSSGDKKVMFHQTNGDIFAVSVVSDQKILDQDSKDDYILSQASNGIGHKVNPDICSAATPICSSTRIDVMVIFTTDARIAWGGLAQSTSFVATAVTNFNNALLNSGVTNTTINLVYAGEITYTESGNISTDLTRFRTNGDGFMDDVHTLRTTYGADVCSLITATPTNTCGLGNLNTNPTNYSAGSAFSVTLYNCAVSNYSMAHEMGHNMGLRHDWYVDTGTTPCDHHHGYTNKTAITLGASSVSSQRWRTIMAYNDECSAAGFNCTRINRWANPGINYNSEPTGIAIGNTNPADEMFAFSRFACVVSNFVPQSATLTTIEVLPQTPEFTLYPNPASETITISLNDTDKYSFKIFNTVGQLILTTSERTITVKNFVPGGYFLSIYNDKGLSIGTKKFIVK